MSRGGEERKVVPLRPFQRLEKAVDDSNTDPELRASLAGEGWRAYVDDGVRWDDLPPVLRGMLVLCGADMPW